MYSTICIFVIILFSNVAAIEYTYDLSGGNDTLVTKECGGTNFEGGEWEFENATMYGFNDGTVYTSSNPACISPNQLLKFTKDSTLNIVGYANYTRGDAIEVLIVNSEGTLVSEWYLEFIDTPKSVNITVDGTTIKDAWVFENEHNLEILSAAFTTGKLSLRSFKLTTPDEITTSTTENSSTTESFSSSESSSGSETTNTSETGSTSQTSSTLSSTISTESNNTTEQPPKTTTQPPDNSLDFNGWSFLIGFLTGLVTMTVAFCLVGCIWWIFVVRAKDRDRHEPNNLLESNSTTAIPRLVREPLTNSITASTNWKRV